MDATFVQELMNDGFSNYVLLGVEELTVLLRALKINSEMASGVAATCPDAEIASYWCGLVEMTDDAIVILKKCAKENGIIEPAVFLPMRSKPPLDPGVVFGGH